MPKQLFQRQTSVPRNSKLRAGGGAPMQQQDWGRKKGKIKKKPVETTKPASSDSE